MQLEFKVFSFCDWCIDKERKMSEENLQAKQEKERLIDLLFPSRKKDEKSLDNNVIKAVNYESTQDESLDSQFDPKKEKTVGIKVNEKSSINNDNPRIMNYVNDDFLQDEMDDKGQLISE